MFSFKMSDADGVMHELADEMISVKFRRSSVPMELMPILTPKGIEYYRDISPTKNPMAQLRHSPESEYETEWAWLREWRKRKGVHPDIWNAVVIAMCVQCATEGFITWGSSGDLAERIFWKLWVRGKVKEFGKPAGDTTTTDDFLENCEARVLSGMKFYSRIGNATEFLVFNEYLEALPSDSPIFALRRFRLPRL